VSTEPLPSFNHLRGLIASKKPPLAARVVERTDGQVTREASVVFDGINGWFIDDGTKLELRAAEDRVVFVEEGGLERIGPGMVANSNTWVKNAIDGRRMAYLDRADGEVLGPDELGGRPCWLARASGLRSEEEVVVLLHVDRETGVLMRTAREDLDVTLDVEELMLGAVTQREPEPEADR
jgi:hypothetical protein